MNGPNAAKCKSIQHRFGGPTSGTTVVEAAVSDDLMSPVLGAGTVEYEWMTWPEIAAAAAADAPVVIAVGSTEQHGPHLPVSADWVVPQALLRLAAARRPFIVGPPLRLRYPPRPAPLAAP